MRAFIDSILGRGLQRHFRTPLVDLGSQQPELAGIFMPATEVGQDKIGLSEQFQANAAQYAARYAASDDATMILGAALDRAGYQRDAGLRVLDIGTGSGANSVIPCLRLFDGCKVVATDLSTELLALLQDYLRREGLSDRVACVCTDAMQDHFKPAQFDVVVGSAILHHLIEPRSAVDAAFRALKPGGIALFVEPFEGFALLGQVFKRMLDDGRELPEHIRAFLKAMRTDFAARQGTDKSDIRFKYMDDKWLFTRTYIDDVRRRSGFSSVQIVPYLREDGAHHYEFSTQVMLRCAGIEPVLPEWAWDYVRELDAAFTPEMKQDALLEGTIVFRK